MNLNILNFFTKKQKNIENRILEYPKCCYPYKIDIDDYLYEQIFKGDAVIFAGAGISTERKIVFPDTFYEEIARELDILDNNLSFPEVMEEYCKLPDGRKKMIDKLQQRFDYIDSFSGLERIATTFYRELATLYPIQTIITTNWDLYFEKYCKAISFVNEEDMAFWDENKRKVLKIHGSISSYGSIIATSTDYKKAQETLHKGVLGSKLKTLLAEKNIIFIGYSFRDTDFQDIYSFVKESLGDFYKQSYVVTPFKEEAKRFEDIGFKPIITDGQFFIKQIKEKAITEERLLSDKIYDDAKWLLEKVQVEHYNICNHIKIKDYPHIIQTMAYQDGMIDGLERAITYRTTGEYSNPYHLNGKVQVYDEILEEKIRDKKYDDISYVEGYLNALSFLLLSEDERPSEDPPLYYLYGYYEFDKIKDFLKALKKYPKKFKLEYNAMVEFTKEIRDGEVYHHTPFLV